MANTFLKIASVSLASSQANIEFTSIPSIYTDLCAVFSLRTTAGDFPSGFFQLNGSTTGFTTRNLWGSGSSAVSDTTARWLGYLDGNAQTASTFASLQLYIPNYTSSNHKSVSAETVAETNATAAYMNMAAHIWANTAAINSLTVTSSSNFAQYSTATLYGISKS